MSGISLVFSSGETVDVKSLYEKRLVGSKRIPVNGIGGTGT